MTIFLGVNRLKHKLPRRAVSALYIFLVLFTTTGTQLLIAQTEQSEIPKFSVNANLVRLFVSVRDRSTNAIVTNLNKDDFTVTDENTAQQIAIFERNTSMPLSIAILVDTSGSTRKDLAVETNAILKFLKAVKQAGNDDDALAVYSFNWQVRMDVGFTRSEHRAERALRSLQNEGGTSLYDAIYLVSDDISEREGRHVMIVVTDGGDTTSYKKFDEAVQAALRSDSILYPVVIVPIQAEAGRNTGGEHALDTLARATGGRPFYPAGATALNDAFSDILRELRTQYLLGYYPKAVPTASRRYHRVTVKTEKSDLKVTARSGYYEP
jgi:Ca-activated chloride channel family protein